MAWSANTYFSSKLTGYEKTALGVSTQLDALHCYSKPQKTNYPECTVCQMPLSPILAACV